MIAKMVSAMYVVLEAMASTLKMVFWTIVLTALVATTTTALIFGFAYYVIL